MTATACAQCGAVFDCRPGPHEHCWCLDLPPLPMELLGREPAGCLCPVCLQNQLASVSPGQAASSSAVPAGAVSAFTSSRADAANHATGVGPRALPPGEGSTEGVQP